MAIENKILTFGGNKIATVGGNTVMGYITPLPVDLGAIAWYKADNVIKNGSNRVSQWLDDSGNSRNLIQASGVNQPLWEASYTNSNPTVNFDSETIFKTLSGTFGADITGVFDCFVIADIRTGGGSYPNFFAGTDPNKRIDFGWFSNNLRIVNANPTVTSVNLKVQTLPFTARRMQITWNTTNSKYYENGIQVGGTFNFGASHVLNGLVLGNFHTPDNLGRLTGRISEIIIFNKVLNSSEKLQIDNYLFNKYGL